MFCSLHNHTYASNIRFLDSINKPEEMINKAINLGFSGIAFTDHESLSAAISILKIRDKILKEYPEFKIIFGNEIYLIDESEIKNTKNYYHFILLAKDSIGWQQLKELSSKAWTRGYTEKGIMRVPTTYQDIEEVIGSNQGHIIALNACIGGYLDQCIINHEVNKANEFIKWNLRTFGTDNFCIELQAADSEEQILCNQILIKLARHYSIPFVVTTDSHYLDKEDFGIHSAFLNSKKSLDRETEKFYKYTYIMSEDEMTELLQKSGLTDNDIQEAFENSVKIGSLIENFDFRHSVIIPSRKLPEFKLSHSLSPFYDKYSYLKDFAYSDSDQDRYLIYLIEEGLKNKNVKVDELRAERINTELDVIKYISVQLNQNLSAYLNLAVDIVNLAWQVSLVGCGRGSACGFYINYLIGITQVDPLVYNLPWWRFANKERVDLFDIDGDYQPEKTEEIIQILRDAYGEDNVLNCATFKTESLKSAVLTCMRGLGYNNDDAQALAALVPIKRGISYTLKECLYGNEEKGLDPVPEFENKIKQYPGVFEAVQKIEGMPTNASIHASALYIFNNGYLAQNSLMRAPNKTKMTAFNMHDSDDMGALKMDILRTDAQSKMAKCLDLLLKDGQIEWQGSLRKTYDKYLHPDVLDYDTPEMWDKAASGEIANLFQFETQVGAVCIKKARPTNVMQLAEINSIMRLQAEHGEQPIDRYVKFRNNIDLWYLEMLEEGLTTEEIKILEKYLKESFGISGSQEKLMVLVMDPNIANFSLRDANDFRKAIAKKIGVKILENKDKYFKKGAEVGARKEFLNYIWRTCIEPQLGYSFSLNHTLPYSVVAVQEMNLATKFNSLYWQCACLCINSGNFSTEFGEESEEIDIDKEDSTEEEKAKRTVAPNYGKIAKAIDDAQHMGVKIELPDINIAQADFVPDIKNNSILYSLKAVNVVNDDLLERIFANRPFVSAIDFFERVAPTQGQMIGLLKAGCFDNLERKDRRVIVEDFFNYLSQKEIPIKEKLTTAHLKKAINLGLNLENYNNSIKLYNFKKYIDEEKYDKQNCRYILDEEKCVKFFNNYIEQYLNISKGEYTYIYNDISIKKSAFDKMYNSQLKGLMEYLNSPEGLQLYCDLERESFKKELIEKYCKGNTSSWEMETMCFYHGDHEFKKVKNSEYNIKNFNDLPEIPVEYINSKGKNVIDSCCVAGTVINADNAKHIVSLSTLYGVINIKFFASMYGKFNQKISVVDNKTKAKTVLDDSWFKRGNKIIVHGYRRENMFTAKTDYSQGYGGVTVGLIENIYADGSLNIRYQRKTK